MSNKFVTLFIREAPFRGRLILLLVMIPAAFFISKSVQIKKTELAKAKEEKQLVMLTPGMEKELKAQELKRLSSTLPKPTKTAPTINGIIIKDNIPSVLSGEDVYQEGDSIGNYLIYKVTPRSVTLEDKTTGQKQEAYLSE